MCKTSRKQLLFSFDFNVNSISALNKIGFAKPAHNTKARNTKKQTLLFFTLGTISQMEKQG